MTQDFLSSDLGTNAEFSRELEIISDRKDWKFQSSESLANSDKIAQKFRTIGTTVDANS